MYVTVSKVRTTVEIQLYYLLAAHTSMTLHTLFQDYLTKQTQLLPNTRAGYAGLFSTLPAPADLTSDFFRRRSQELSPVTLRHVLTITRKFLRWWSDQAKTKAEQHRIELIMSDLKTVKPRKLTESVTVEDLYTPDELRKVFGACGDTRDLTMYQVLYESGCRARELLSMTFERVKLHDDGTATVVINGKTGTREIPLYRSVPALKAWLNVHPVGHGPIWTGLRRPFERITYTGFYCHAKTILERAGLKVDKKRILHMFRHSRATELVRLGVRGQSLSKLMGWTPRSNMEAVYVHLSNDDANSEMSVKVFGIEPGTEKPAPILSITKCPKCGEHNDAKARFCVKCNLPLSTDLIVQRLTEKEQLEERVEDLTRVLTLVLEKLGLNDIQLPITDGTISFSHPRRE